MTDPNLEPYKSDHLILLVGGNPLPNAVATELLINEGGTITLLHSQVTASIAQKLRNWLVKKPRLNSIVVTFKQIDERSSKQIFEGVTAQLKRVEAESVGLHYTGGTKTMAVHAYRAVEQWAQNKPSPIYSYLDAQTLSLVIDSDPSPILLRGKVKLTFDDLLELHGWQKKSVTTEPILPQFADAMLKLYSHQADVEYWNKWKGNELHANCKKANANWKSNTELEKITLKWPKAPELAYVVEALQTELQQNEVGLDLKSATKASGLHKAQEFCKQLDGGYWLETCVLQALQKISESHSLHDICMNIHVPLGNNKDDFEFDVVAMGGYQLYGFSCCTDDARGLLKHKLFEAYVRAQQLGGDEARAALVCSIDDPNGLEREMRRDISPHIKVFGRQHLANLSAELARWINPISGGQGGFSMYIMIVDTVRIQPYIFGSNRLKENIGASYFVAMATEEWAEESLTANRRVLYAGGGNFVATVETEEEAKQFIRKLSQKALCEAPGLQLVITCRKRGEKESLATAVAETFKQLRAEKLGRVYKEPLLGVSVTTMCRSTAFPAVGMTEAVNNDPTSVYPAAAEILAKLGAAHKAAGKRLSQAFPLPDGFVYPRDFDDMGREKGEQSHIAVVHADGNGIGKLFDAIAKQYLGHENDDLYAEKIKSLSEKIKQASRAAMQATIDALCARICQDEPNNKDAIRQRNCQGEMIAEVILKKEGDTVYLPFRPLVFGGDDVTFVCDGRLGISLAVEYLQQFEAATESIVGNKLTACAGIAIVRSHYPFARAYGLADELCNSAKRYQHKEDLVASRLDWHFALTGLSGSIGEIRQREYTTYPPPEQVRYEEYKGESLTLRPLTLGKNDDESHRSFDVVLNGVRAFQDTTPGQQEPNWSTRRNKVMGLREALRNGPSAVEQFRKMYNIDALPRIDDGKSNFQSKGWWGGWCGYFDAIELMDWFISMEMSEEKSS